MGKRALKWIKIGEWLLNHRWWLVTSISLLVFSFEYVEYQPFTQGVSDSFFFEILFYGILLPLSTGLALSWLAASRSELAWLAYYQNLKHNFDLQLSNAHSEAKLASSTLQFIKVVLPVIGASFYTYDQDTRSSKTILNWFPYEDTNRLSLEAEGWIGGCPCPMAFEEIGTTAIHPCTLPKPNPSSVASSSFCLPFIFSDHLVGVARLYIKPGIIPSQEQVLLLDNVAPEVASALHRIKLERLMEKNYGEINSEQRRIARDVHDTLGHSLAYLRLRLDQISMEIDQTDVDILKQDVENLQDVAKEAYHQMRNILIALSPDDDSNIEAKLERFIEMIKKRSNIEIQFHSCGKSYHLPQSVQRNIYYIFQEALANIEQHANAKQVKIELNWNDAFLSVDVRDDGVGFDTSMVKNGHFGLINMKKRASECNAQLSISSQVSQGTQLVLKVPYGGKE